MASERWIPVAERVPGDMREVLLATPVGREWCYEVGTFDTSVGDGHFRDDFFNALHPSHWQELTAPTEESDDALADAIPRLLAEPERRERESADTLEACAAFLLNHPELFDGTGSAEYAVECMRDLATGEARSTRDAAIARAETAEADIRATLGAYQIEGDVTVLDVARRLNAAAVREKERADRAEASDRLHVAAIRAGHEMFTSWINAADAYVKQESTRAETAERALAEARVDLRRNREFVRRVMSCKREAMAADVPRFIEQYIASGERDAEHRALASPDKVRE